MSNLSSIVRFSDVKDNPSVRMTLPGPLPLGTRLVLNFLLRRKHGPRTEELKIDGEFKVTGALIDTTGSARQVVTVEAVRVAPAWRAVKNQVLPRRHPPPARSPRTVVA